MKRLVCLLITCLLLPFSSAAAEDRWFVADSHLRELSMEELAQWNYESLGYILNEIYARHGYHFMPGSEYEAYFLQQDWYTPNARNNLDGCFAEMSELELHNAELIQKAMQQQLRQGDMNFETGRSVWSDEPVISPLFFTLADFPGDMRFSVYSAPGSKTWRGAKGKAAVSTNGDVWAAGWADEWLLIYYETNQGSIRVGYIDAAEIADWLEIENQLVFSEKPAQILRKCGLTDDPAREASHITSLKQGKEVTYLTSYMLDEEWAYIETKYEKKKVRAFVPMDCIAIMEDE